MEMGEILCVLLRLDGVVLLEILQLQVSERILEGMDLSKILHYLKILIVMMETQLTETDVLVLVVLRTNHYAQEEAQLLNLFVKSVQLNSARSANQVIF